MAIIFNVQNSNIDTAYYGVYCKGRYNSTELDVSPNMDITDKSGKSEKSGFCYGREISTGDRTGYIVATMANTFVLPFVVSLRFYTSFKLPCYYRLFYKDSNGEWVLIDKEVHQYILSDGLHWGQIAVDTTDVPTGTNEFLIAGSLTTDGPWDLPTQSGFDSSQLEHCTATCERDESNEFDEVYIVDFTAETGYTLKECWCTDYDGNNRLDATVSEDGTTARLYSTTQDLVAHNSIKLPTHKFVVEVYDQDHNLVSPSSIHTSFDMSQEFEEGSTISQIFGSNTITITSDNSIDWDNSGGPYFTFSTATRDDCMLVCDYDDTNVGVCSIGSTYQKYIPTSDIRLSMDVIVDKTVYYITQNLTHVTSDCSLDHVDSGSNLVVTLTNDTGYHFESTPTATMNGVNVDSSQLETGYQFSFNSIDGDIVIDGVAISDTPTEQNNADYGFINIYNPTLSELQNIASKYFINFSTGTATQLTEYIIGMFQIFGKPLTLSTREPVKFGKYNTGVGCKVVREPVVEIDCGTIHLSEKYNSALDYDQYVNARIWLPFCGFFDIGSDLFMNGDLSLKYKIDVLTGKCVASLSSSKLDSEEPIIYNFCGSAMMKIPYYVNGDEQRTNGAINNDVYNMATRKPYVIVTRKISVTPNSSQLDGEPSNDYVKLGDLTGFTKCDTVMASGMISTQAEKSEIESLLKKGVIL